ncbi:hypothetical protein K0B93_17945 [Marinobacter sp. F4218]|nr:hypothetical protein [Marinobacter sp. F4218]
MNDQHIYTALVAEGSAVPTLLCGHCGSILSRARIFRNEGDRLQDVKCMTVGLCSADDCGAVNCCDSAMASIENPDQLFGMAS